MLRIFTEYVVDVEKWWPIVLAVLVIGIVGRSYYVMHARYRISNMLGWK